MSSTSITAARPLRARDRLTPPDRRRHRGVSRAGAVSFVLHLAILALLVVTVTRRKLNDQARPGAVTVMFEGGAKPAPKQAPESRQSNPQSPPDQQAQQEQPQGSTQARPAPPSHAAMPSATPAPSAAALSPPLAPGISALKLPPVTPHPSRPQRLSPARPAASSPFGSLSAPMNLSLAGHAPPPASRGHLKRGIDLTMAPTAANQNIMTRYAEARRRLGEDWWAAFTQFVEDHKYYPMEAAQRGEDGQCVLRLVIARDGSVLSVKLALSSGSPRLDEAWISEFRNAKVPPFPPGTEENEISFPASMTYILEQR